jgi:hypothetical protein
MRKTQSIFGAFLARGPLHSRSFPGTGRNFFRALWKRRYLRRAHRIRKSSSGRNTGTSAERWKWPKDYRDDNAQKTMTLEADEFIRHFLLHALPQGPQRIRYYGLLGSRLREAKLAQCRQLLKMEPKTPRETDAKPSDYRDRYQALTSRTSPQRSDDLRPRRPRAQSANAPYARMSRIED